MRLKSVHFEKRVFSPSFCLKEAVLASFHRPASEVAARLAGFLESEWQGSLYWLDISGMALYLLDQLKILGLENSVPLSIRARLESNLSENQERTAVLLREAALVAERMIRARVPFVLLKGVTLMPDSVPDCSLRWQTDLDFLVAEGDANSACEVLGEIGYTHRATSGQTMEFKAGPSNFPDLANLYRAHTQRALELHLMRMTAGTNRLTRAKPRTFYGVSLPSLSPPDILVQQALHLLKHLCGEHTRTSWVLEFWRNCQARQHDDAFWDAVKCIAATEPHGDVALGISILLATELFGAIGAGPTEQWTTARLPNGARLWVMRYGRKLLLSDSIGSKLYLILLRQLNFNEARSSHAWRLLFPVRLPIRISQAAPDETLRARLTRYGVELRYFLGRLRFHLVEGLRYAIESLRWQWSIARFES